MCGYDTNARQFGRRLHDLPSAAGEPSISVTTRDVTFKADRQWQRKAAYDFTGCLAHVDVTYNDTESLILRIVGYLQHNEACLQATMKRFPSIPLHEHVYEVALRQLRHGAGYV